MASRKKDPAALRTLSLFTGKTAVEEAEAELGSIALETEVPRDNNPLAMRERQEETAVRWLGLDAFAQGDDLRVAVHPKGHTVLMLVREQVPGSPFHTSTIKLTAAQWTKLKALARGEG